MKNRGICLGGLAFLGTIILLAAGCNLGVAPETGSGSSPQVDKNGNYIIKVNTKGMAPRSIDPGDASLYAEEYEIVCRDQASPYPYFSGYTRGGNLTVSLPEGRYDMLVLAGNGSRVLLGTGWQPNQDIGPDTGSVTILVKPLTILEGDMTFDDGEGNSNSPSGTPPTFPSPTLPVDPDSDDLITTFTLKNIDALEKAAVVAGITPNIYTGPNGFAAIKVAMKYYDDDHKNNLISSASLDSFDNTTTIPNVDLTFNPLTYTAGGDWSALVYLNLEYIPFSQSGSPISGHKWSILNGLGKNASNGAVKVTAGTGGNVTIDISTDF
jgi:hypothetical protein